MASTKPNSTQVLLFIDREGKTQVLLESERYAPLGYAIPSPDGRYLALRKAAGDINVWMIENF